MEVINFDDVNYMDHLHKCRICFKRFGIDEHQIGISKLIARKFRDLTQTDLKLSENYSRTICVLCNFQLKNFCVFRKNVIQLQKGLYRITSLSTNNSEEWVEDVAIKQEEIEHPQKGFVSHDQSYIASVVMSNEPESEFLDCGDLKFGNEADDEKTLRIRVFECDKCNYKHWSRLDLNAHMLSHVKMDDNIVDSFSSERAAQPNHEPVFQCSKCDLVFETFQSSLNHKIKMHPSEKEPTKWVCRHCNKSFSGSRILRDHITIVHAVCKPQIHCPLRSCNKVFLTTKRLRAHMKVHDDDCKEMCNECGLLVTSKHNLEKHIKRVHLRLRNFFCDICGYSATFKHSISSHMTSHIDPASRRKWKCELCSFVSVSKQSLRAHKSYEHSGKVYTCHCGKEFNQRASLSTHIKCVHHKQKDHSCTICGKAYFTRKDLANHRKSQHFPKDLPCSICGKLFATTKHLTRHRLYHEEPKYKCHFEGCSKAFIDNAKLKDHMKLHEGNRDHLCHLCEKAYFHQKDLKRHLDVHHSATIYFCELCTFTIGRKDYLRNHLNSAHKHLSIQEKNEILLRTKVTRNIV